MWVTNGDVIYSLPDDARIPRGIKAIELPADYRDDPRAYDLKGFRLVPAKRAKRTPRAILTVKEIEAIKAAIAAGKI